MPFAEEQLLADISIHPKPQVLPLRQHSRGNAARQDDL